MRNSQLLCSQLFFFSPVLGDGKRSACSLALVAPSNPFTPMSMNHHDYSACSQPLQTFRHRTTVQKLGKFSAGAGWG